MSQMTMEQRLALDHYNVDGEPHIRVKAEACRECHLRACLYVCPAECFKLAEDRVSFGYEGCLECGSCRIACDRGAIDWSYPRAGFGISYEFG